MSLTPPIPCEGFAPPPSPIDRYYHQRYILNDNEAGDPIDTFIHFHNNGIAVIGLAPSHAIITRREIVTKVAWSNVALSASSTVMTGKRKHGSNVIQSPTVLCTITTTATPPPPSPPNLLTPDPPSPPSFTYTVRSGVRGQLLEVNDRLLTQPSLVSDATTSQWEGFIAAVLMDKTQHNDISRKDHAEYKLRQEWEQRRGKG